MKPMKKDIRKGETVTTFFALEAMKLQKSKSNNSYYLNLALYDKTGKIKGYLWDNPKETALTLTEKSIVKVKGTGALHNDSLILNIKQIRTARKDETDIRDFIEVVSGGVEIWQNKLTQLIRQIKNADCRRLADAFLSDEAFMEQFLTAPAGVSVHHNYIGGLLEHTVNTMVQASQIADSNPGLIDKDVLLTGAFLHDIGKTEEIYWEIAKEYTTKGKLIGHISIGLLLLEEKLKKLKNFPEDLSIAMEHMVLSHHGTLEHGSPVKPATPEAVALHLIDNVDAKINHLYCHLANSNPNETWSYYDNVLNTAIYQRKIKKREEQKMEVAA